MLAKRTVFNRPLALALLLALAPLAAQAQNGPRIEQQMTAEQFKQAGLDQLNPEQLANLNAWLNRKLDTETTKAAREAETKVKSENRGFFSFGSNEPINSRLVGEFKGYGRGKLYVLENGQEWKQEDDATLVGVKLNDPQVRITPSVIGNAWYLSVQGYGTRAKVTRTK